MLVKINTESVELLDCTLIACGDRVAIIDTEDAERITPYHWYLRRTFYNVYAYRKKITNGKEFFIFMHRQIMHTRNDEVVHHWNRFGLDNRKLNMINWPPQEHHEFHRFR